MPMPVSMSVRVFVRPCRAMMLDLEILAAQSSCDGSVSDSGSESCPARPTRSRSSSRKEHLLVAVERVDDQRHQLVDLRLCEMFGDDTSGRKLEEKKKKKKKTKSEKSYGT
jgi:hypothetical protein